MTTYILILTLAAKANYASLGGLEMQEFNTKESCYTAGRNWSSRASSIEFEGDYVYQNVFYLCVKK